MKRRRSGRFIVSLFAVFIISTLSAHAELFNRGTDTQGYQLIYDDDLNITWYDYTKDNDFWQNQVNWAAGLDVDFGGTHYTDWRLPSTVDGSFVFGSNGTTTAGYNITNSEMGHLYYTELGNKGYWATDGTHPQLGWGLTNKGDFQHLIADIYWSGTEYSYYTSTDNAWVFNSYYGVQSTGDETLHSLYALAVRPGDVTVVPEPVSSMLFLTGGSLLVCRRYLVRSKA